MGLPEQLATWNPFLQWGLYLVALILALAGVRLVQRMAGREVGARLGYPVAGLLVLSFLWCISEPHHRLYADFFKAYYPAADLVWREGPGAIRPIIESRDFVNIPIVAWLFVPLTWLGEKWAGFLFLTLGVAATLGAWRLISRIGRLSATSSWLLLFLFLVNGPMVYGFREGNTTHMILFLLVVALLLLRRGADYGAGLVLGFCAVIKLPLMLFGVYFLIRRKWGVVAGGATSLIAAGVLSLAIFGGDINRVWYDECVAPFKGQPMPAYNVQSIGGFLIRLETGAERLRDWDPRKPEKATRWAHRGILACLYGGLLAAGVLARRRATARPFSGALSRRDLLEFAVVLNLALVTSPVSWSHYYLYLLLPWGLWIGRSLPLPNDAITRWLFRGSVLLSTMPVVILPLGGDWLSDLAAKTLVSACLAGGLLSLAALARGFLPPCDGKPLVSQEERQLLPRGGRLVIFVLLILIAGGPSWSWTSSHLIQITPVILLVPALWLAGSARWRGWLDLARARFDAISDRRLALCVSLWVSVAAAAIATFVFEGAPNVADTFSYLLQAKIFASGAASVPVPGPGIDLAWTVQRDGRIFSVFTPGWPALLAVGVWAGLPHLINALLAGGACGVMFLTLRELSGRRVARVALLLSATSPFLLFLSGSMMAHTSALFFVMLSIWCLALPPGRMPRMARDFLGGFALAVAFTIRPQDAVPVWCALAVYLLWTERLRAMPRLVMAGAALSLGLLANAQYFHEVAGVWSPTNSFLRQPGDEFGFGSDIGFPDWEDNFATPGHNPWRSLLNFNFNMAVMNSDLLGWPIGVMPFALLFLVWGAKDRGHRLGLLIFGFLTVLNSGFWYHAVCMGARLYFIAMPFILLFAVSGLLAAPEILARVFRLPPGIHVTAFICTLVILSTAWCVCFHIPRLVLVTPYRSFCYMSNEVHGYVGKHRLDNALLFVHPAGEAAWPGLMLNTFPTDESRVICLPDQGEEINARTATMYPGREVHHYETDFATARTKRKLRRLSLWLLAGHAQVSADPVPKQYLNDLP